MTTLVIVKNLPQTKKYWDIKKAGRGVLLTPRQIEAPTKQVVVE